jgi:methyltransferase (TIGR00027 family)
MLCSPAEVVVMAGSHRPIRDIADTAWWTAVYRARESERTDALFRDPFARRLAGERGAEIWEAAERQKKSEWSMAARTLLFDRLILDHVRKGADMIVSLAAGLDARPYRLDLPRSLAWVEVDLPDLLEYKASVLAGENPVCVVERIPLDLADAGARRDLFARLGRRAERPLVVSEGLLIYLERDAVGSLARDLAAAPGFRKWILDLVSPGLLSLMRKNLGEQLTRAGAPLEFGPEEGPGFFSPYGWDAVDVRSLLKAGARAGRLPLLMRLVAMFPEPTDRLGSRPWSGVCVMEKRSA